MTTELTIDNRNMTHDQAHANVQKCARQLGVKAADIDQAAYAAVTFVQVRHVAGLPVIWMVSQSSDGEGTNGVYNPGRWILGYMYMRTPNNRNTSGFGQHWFSETYDNTNLAVRQFNELVKQMKKGG